MRIVATAAGHRPEPHRVRIGLLELRLLLLVTGVTDLGLVIAAQHRVLLGMHVVTLDTGPALGLVHAAEPAVAQLLGVAPRADRVLFLDACAGALGEQRHRHPALAAIAAPGMRATGSVAGLALQLARRERRARIVWIAMRGQKYRVDMAIVVTGKTGIGTAPAVAGLGTFAICFAGLSMANRRDEHCCRKPNP